MRHEVSRFIMAAALLLSVASPAHPGEAPSDSSRSDPPHTGFPAPEADAILYYFHRTTRCQSCLNIEAYIDEALRTHFAGPLEEGRLLWRPTNIEMPENYHFEEDFSLEFNSAILVRLEGGKTVSWTNLEKVWDLLETKEQFIRYVRAQVTPVLEPDGKEAGSRKPPTGAG